MRALPALPFPVLLLCLALLPATLALAAPAGPAASYAFTVERDTLTMRDGVKLAVTYWKPKAKTSGETFPVFFELNGYRKDDLSYLSWDYPVGAYFARHGYVVAKVDLRGTGASGGALPEAEYSEQELADCVNVVDLLSKKDWSSGRVGMYGLSWGAFNSLMTARRKPPALKAILIAHSSDDLYYQDVHFIDGVMHSDVWEAMMDTYNALPDTRDYALTPEFFANRFDREPWHHKWKGNNADGPFWRRESARFNPPVELPVYIIGGLLDGYRDTVARLLDSPNRNIKADLGPWKHDWPNTGTPGPNYEWRRKALRWWDRWLKGLDNGIMDEPRFMVFMRDSVPPSEELETTPGQWRCGDWPVGGTTARRLHPAPGRRLSPSAPAEGPALSLAYKAGAGTCVHGWWGETSGDMAFDDESALVFDSEPLKETLEIMGLPKVSLDVSADAPLYQWAVRLEDVWPDGSVSLISGTLINPADRESRLAQKPLAPGEKTRLAAEIHFTTWRFKPRHRIRLSISNAQFPMAWPSPHKGATRLHPGPGTSVELPVVEKNTLTRACDLPRPEPEQWPPDASYSEQNEGKNTHIDYDPETGAAVYSCGINQKMTIRGTKYHMREKNTWKVNDKDPAHATYEAVTDYGISPGGRELRLRVTFRMASDEKNFRLTTTRQLYEDQELVRERKWERAIPRKNH
ncbi:MAG: CocE/NonD family hydrolase [Proteobacteria bacterium]|nr:CocE/NonD family hydrolase [Pseudomonadota bacterium]MBU1596684.1 CocE/NonD family hydrolase [Pseudomonadota bacterium]